MPQSALSERSRLVKLTESMLSEVRIGEVVARFRVESLIREGAMGAVYRATDTKTGARVALKLLIRELSRDARFRQRFLRETQIARCLAHDHVVATVDAGEQDGVLYLAMAYIEGVDLRMVLQRDGCLEPSRALHLLEQVAAALDAAHDAGLVHRDVKPANILVATEGERENAYVCDFGLARHVSSASSLTSDRGFVGTIDYVPPEQIEGGMIDRRADVYSLACVLYECLAGTRPFDRESELAVVFAHLNEAPPLLSDVRPDLPPVFDAIFTRALAKSPADRYPTCGELIDAAKGASDGKRVTGSRSARRGKRLTAAALAVSVAAAAVVLLLPGTHAKAAAIAQSSIVGAQLGLSGRAYEARFGHPWTEILLPESGHLKLTFPDRDVAVYFKGLTDTAVEITTWNKAYKTAAGVGPCSTIQQLKAAYGHQLKPSKFNTQHGIVYAWTVGRNLIFASNSQAVVDAVALFYGDAPGADKSGGSLSYASYIALNEQACS